MTRTIPTTKKPHFLRSERFAAWLAIIGSVAGAAYLLYDRAARDDSPLVTAIEAAIKTATPAATAADAAKALEKLSAGGHGRGLALLGLVWVIATSAHKLYIAHTRDAASAARVDTHPLLGPLMVLDETVRRIKGLEADTPHFRATLHRVSKDDHEQIVPYVGYTTGKERVGRKWSNHCGLVGQVARSGGKTTEPRLNVMKDGVTTAAQFAQALVNDFGYNQEQAKNLESTRISQLAIPIHNGDPRNVIGVVYCDSTERDFFDDAIATQCVNCAIAIAKYVAMLY